MVTEEELAGYGIKDPVEIIYNPSYNTLFLEETLT
jgi:hypothetical protein